MATLLAFSLLVSSLSIHDHGTHGHTFPIEEEDLIEYLQKRMESLSLAEIGKINHSLRANYEKHLLEPAPVPNLSRAREYAIHYYDPTVVAKQEIRDGQGNIIVKKGSSYNPLNDHSLKEELLFFDGSDSLHVAWAKSLGEETKWILTSGRPLEIEEQEKRPVYFDQNGLLTQKLKIATIPARVTQEDNRLKIETIPVEVLK